MKIHQHHRKRIAHTIFALNAAADKTTDAKLAELLIEAAFYLTEMGIKHTWPEALTMIEDYRV